MYCTNCGKEIDDKAVVCPHCGVPTCNYVASRNTAQPGQGSKALVNAAKVFIILSFIAYAISFVVLLCLTCASAAFLGEGSTEEENILFVMFLICLILIVVFGIVGIIFGARALKNIKQNTKPSVLLSVLILIFTNVVAGVLLLCTKDEDYLL